MKYLKFTSLHLLLLVLFIAIAIACVVEQKSVTGQSSTRSPDGNWCLNLRLTEYSNLFRSRKVLDASLEHSTREDWNVGTSFPLNEADAETISNKRPSHPIVWSEDSSTVTYWINEQQDDWIKIEANDDLHKFQRKLYSTSVTYTAGKKGK